MADTQTRNPKAEAMAPGGEKEGAVAGTKKGVIFLVLLGLDQSKPSQNPLVGSWLHLDVLYLSLKFDRFLVTD